MYDNDDDDRPIGHSNTCVQKERRSIPWLWEGVLAEEAVTLLSAPEKVGKTTLLSLLLDRRRAGGQLLGRTVYPGKTILCSEENKRLWTLRQPPLDFGPDLIFHQPPWGHPTRGRWKRFIEDVCNLSFQDNPFDLLVIDTAVSFLPLADRNKRTLRWALSQLTLVAGFPAAVLVINQSRNVHRPLAAFADIVIEMAIPRGHTPLSPYGRGLGSEGVSTPLSPYARGAGSEGVSTPLAPYARGAGSEGVSTPLAPYGRGVGGEGTRHGEGTRRRTFTAVGRYPDTLQTAAAELNPDGTDYVLLQRPHTPLSPYGRGARGEGSPPLLPTLQTLLTESPTPLTRHDLLARWPGIPPRPDTLWRTLTRGLELGLFTVTGTGTKTDAFRYGMASQTKTAPG